MRELLYAWNIGKAQRTHVGFGVYTLKPNGFPGELVAEFQTAEEALTAAEPLGDQHAVFRIYTSKGLKKPCDLIARADLPVIITRKLS
jgi:hypothetical protein